MAKKKQPTAYDDLITDAVSTSFDNIEELKGELENWYENLPESFQSGEKGDQLQEAIDGLESQAPDVPECLSEIRASYELTLKRRMSRADRCSECILILDAVITAAETEKDRLADLDFNDDGVQIDENDQPVKTDDGVAPMDEDERDNSVSEIESFISECEEAKTNWECVEFPRMYG